MNWLTPIAFNRIFMALVASGTLAWIGLPIIFALRQRALRKKSVTEGGIYTALCVFLLILCMSYFWLCVLFPETQWTLTQAILIRCAACTAL